MKKRNVQYYTEEDDISKERGTVIVSPTKSNREGRYAFNGASGSQQDSASSGDDEEARNMPAVHKTFIKPKSTAAPVINQKATAMMVSLYIFH